MTLTLAIVMAGATAPLLGDIFTIHRINIFLFHRIIDPGHGTPVIRNAAEFAGYKESMDNLRRNMPIVGFSRDVSLL